MKCLAEFHEHPAAAGQTYLQHLEFAVRFGASLRAAGAAAILHGFVPCWFQTTASRAVTEMYGRLHARPVELTARVA